MKTVGTALVIAFLFLITKPKVDKNYPELVEVNIKETKTFEEQMMDTPLYKNTLRVEDTIMETHRIIEQLKHEANKRPTQITIR